MLAAITVALVGLVAMQVVWIHKTVSLREEQFVRAVDNALFDVSEQLERTERMAELRRHRSGRRLLVKLDSLRNAGSISAIDERSEANETQEDLLVIPEGPFTSSEEGAAHERLLEEREAYEEMVTDMVRSILANEVHRGISKRVHAPVVDSLLRAAFAPLGLRTKIQWGVFKSGGEWVDLPGAPEVDTSLLHATQHRERLFRRDAAGSPYYLHVLADRADASLLSGLWPMLIASVLFIAIIALAFMSTIRTILRQKRLSDIRNDLVNNLTHELKTPISTIGLACEALADPSIPKTEEQVRTFTGMIRDENKRLGALVENVLLSAVQDSGHMVLKPVDLDLHTVVEDVVRSSSMLVARRNGRIEMDLRADIHRMRGDRIHLTNLLYNLIDNAVKYTEKEPRIRIATRSDDEGISLSVTDNGIGIPRSEQRKIFDRLYRVPTGDLHNAKGFGLGLSYVKNVVERHGGHIKLESTPGLGSTFHITLPFEHANAHQAPRGRG